MRKWIIATLTIALTAATAATAFAGVGETGQSKPFIDVLKTNWAHSSIETITDKGIIKGYPDGTFKPDAKLTYGEFIKMATIIHAGEDVGNAASKDNSGNALNWAANYYNKALNLKYFRISQITSSQLNHDITRRDMALIISAILGDVKINNYDEIQSGITDVDFKTIYEYDITKAYALGIITGYPDGTFKPENTLTRAESAVVIERLIDESKRQPTEGNEEEIQAKTYNTSDLLDMSKLTPDRVVSDVAKFTEEYKFYTDASELNVKMHYQFDGEIGAFNHELRGLIYLVKDGVIIDHCQTLPRYDEDGNYLYFQGSIFHSDITKADYIISVPTASASKDKLVQVVVNPFKR
ncbi:MAG: S-layer homology domain-containing protein [Eubacteriales bacterium]|nr:S-layer homology domain-containing protein [Eubacteriales bacterium]MDD4390251.1 S-layer homology domain-containing protein [Eubacteriales bacterium]